MVTLLSISSVFADADKAINVAIITDKTSGLDKSPLIPLLEVELSKFENIKLLERGKIDKILAEKKLQLSFEASANESRMQIGNILGADVILFVKKIVGTDQQEFIDARIVETRTGVILDDVLQDSSDIEKETQNLIKAISPGLSKANVPLNQRHYLGISDIRNEEPGRELNPIATALTQLLKHDLNLSKNIVVLEREQLNYLLNERNLAGVNVQLRASTIILEGGIRRNGNTEYSVSLKFMEPSGTKTKDIAINAPSSDISLIRQEICKAVISSLGDTSEFNISGDSHAEAAYFLKRAISCSTDLAVQLNDNAGMGVFFAETALALDENNIDLRNEVCHCLLYIAEKDWSMSEEERLNVCKRAHEIDLGTIERYTHSDFPDQTYYYLFKVDIYKNTSSEKPSTKEYSELLSEIYAVCIKKYDILYKLFLKENKSPIRLLANRIQFVSDIDTSEQLSQNVKSFVLEYENYPHKNQIGFYDILASALNPIWNKERNNEILPLLEWLRNRSDPTLKMLSYYSISHPEIDNNEAAINVCDLLLLEGAKDVGFASFYNVQNLYLTGKLESYFENIMDIVENEHKYIIFENTRTIREIIGHSGKEKQIDWSRRILSMLETFEISTAPKRDIDELKTYLNNYLVKRDDSPKNNIGSWENYTITPIKYAGRNFEIHQRLKWIHIDEHNKKLIFVWSSKSINNSVYDYTITSIDVIGGPLKQIAKIENKKSLSITCSDDNSNTIFLGTENTGLIMIGPDGCEIFDEATGCPSNNIRAMTYLNNNLYLGFYGSFAKFNPQTRTFEIISSYKAVQTKNDLDGGELYWISSMVSDSRYDSVWFTVYPDKDRSGIWKYNPGKDELKFVSKSDSTTRLVFNNDGILFVDNSPRILNPKSDESVGLQGYSRNVESCLRTYNENSGIVVGTDIISKSGELYTKDGKHYKLGKIWNIIKHFDSGFIAANINETKVELWLVQLKDKAK